MLSSLSSRDTTYHRRPGESRDPYLPWIPACAGMTGKDRMPGWLWDCYVTSEGLEFRLFRVLPIYRLRRQQIRAVHIVNGWFGHFRLGSRPWNTVAVGTRLRWTWVLIEKRRWPRFLGLTPANPEILVLQLE